MKATKQRLYFWPIFLGAVTSFLVCDRATISFLPALFYPLLVAAIAYTLIWSSDREKQWRRIAFILCFTFATALFVAPAYAEDDIPTQFLISMGGAIFTTLLLFTFEQGWKYSRAEFWSK